MFENMIGLSEFCVMVPDVLTLCLQMFNGTMLKPNNKICLNCEYQLKQKTINRRE